MKCTYRCVVHWMNNNFKARVYYNLKSNDEEKIIKWLYQQGIIFNICYGVECHDVGDTDYFRGCTEGDKINNILEFVNKLYGEWTAHATYREIDVDIRKQYPNIMHQLSFKYPSEREDKILPLFEKFEQQFCSDEIKEEEEYR